MLHSLPVECRRSVFGACAFAQPGSVGFEHLADLVPHAAKLHQHLLLAALGMGGVVKAPVMAIHLSRIEGAHLVDVAADGDDGCDLAVEERVHVL